MRDVATEGVDRLADDGLDVVHQVAEGEEPQLGLEMGILREVASGVAVLCPEALLDAEDVAERGEAGF